MNPRDGPVSPIDVDPADPVTAAAAALWAEWPTLPLPQEALASIFLPPIAGGSPGIPNPWDVFRGIFGGAADLLGKIGEGFVYLWATFIWPIMGGAIRWLWNATSYGLEYLKGLVVDVSHNVMEWTAELAGDLWEKVSGAVIGFGGMVGDAMLWLWAHVGTVFTTLYNWMSAVGRWVWDQVKAGLDALWSSVSYSLAWGFGRVQDLFGWVTDRTAAAAEWTVDAILPAISGGFDVIGGAFGAAVEGITDKFGDLAEMIGKAIGDSFRWAWDHVLEPFVGVFERKFAIPGKALRGEYESPFDFIDDLMDPPKELMQGVSLFVAALVIAIPSLLIGIIPAFAPVNQRWMQYIARDLPYALLTRTDLDEARWRGLAVDIEDELAKGGYSEPQRRAIEAISHRIPGASDLITMAVREAFTPEIAEKFGQYQDFPAPVEEYLAKQGFHPDDEWARRYWAAHWDLPSATQGFEMLHRGIIDLPTLKMLLRALDVMPYWREKLVAVAYSPLTRVDLRRVYKLGIINLEEVYEGYRALGYDEVNARRLAAFTEKGYGVEEASEFEELSDLSAATIRQGYRRHVLSRDEAMDYLVTAGFAESVADFLLTLDDVQLGIRPDLEADVNVRDLTQASILRAYTTGIWDRSRAQKELEDMGYLPASADLLLQLEDVKYEQDLTDAQVDIVKAHFVRFDIDAAAARRQLAELGVSGLQQDLLLAQWDADMLRAPRKLTTAQLKRAVGAGLMTEGGMRTYLLGLAYGEADADILMQIL